MSESESRSETEITLSPSDLIAVQEQLDHQHADTQAENDQFTQAFLDAKRFAFSFEGQATLCEEQVAELTLRWGRLTYPKENAHGFRSFEAHYGTDLGKPIGSDPKHLVPDMAAWSQLVVAAELEPDELYQRFEQIHPFHDGNGRVGDLWWKVLTKRQTGQWPTTLPPEFVEPQKNKYQSAFGDIEPA